MELFHVDNDGTLQLPESIKILREIRRIWTRDRDRTKKNASRELAFIYHFCHWKSPFSNYLEAERKLKLIEYFELPEGWEPDSELKDAMRVFREITEASLVSLEALKEAKAALLISAQVIRKLRERIEQLLGNESIDGEDIENLVQLQEKVFALSTKLEGASTVVKKLEEQVKKEQSSGTRIRGGGEKGMFEE